MVVVAVHQGDLAAGTSQGTRCFQPAKPGTEDDNAERVRKGLLCHGTLLSKSVD